jgi:hypothetical protein
MADAARGAAQAASRLRVCTTGHAAPSVRASGRGPTWRNPHSQASCRTMDAPHNPAGAVPTSSSRNRHASKRTLTVGAVVVGFLLFAVFFPW